MKTTIAQKLSLSPETYSWMILGAFFKWCTMYANSAREQQELVSSQALLNWFQKEYKKQEEEFLFITSRFENIPTASYIVCYNRCIENVFKLYPKPILERLRRKPTPSIFIPVDLTKIKLNHTLN